MIDRISSFSLVSLLVLLISACAISTPVTDESTAFGEIFLSDVSTIEKLLITTVNGMENYQVKSATDDKVTVFYDPANVFFGSATIDISVSPQTGKTYEGDTVSGVELIMTDKTRWYSEDTSFSAADMMSIIKSNVTKAAKFSKIETTMIQK